MPTHQGVLAMAEPEKIDQLFKNLMDQTKQLLATPLPLPDDILEQRSCHDWLRREAKTLALSPNMLDRIASIGLLGRLWLPTDQQEKAKLARCPSLENTLAYRLKQILSNFNQGYWVLIDREMCRVIDATFIFLENIHTFSNNPVSKEKDNKKIDLAFAQAVATRDLLESCLYTLRIAGYNLTYIEQKLTNLDNLFLSVLKTTTHPESYIYPGMVKIYLAVSWMDIGKWWGLKGDKFIGTSAFDPDE